MAITLGATAASHQEWKNGTQYCKNDTVNYNGSVYQSQWCTTENPEKITVTIKHGKK
ncbi:carbohydrate-binding protein [Mixta mediterraneensis]|uniref:carbohydrate-binding protein n=1 Tax=Mixta mediterraneensis TaxID=2758443 RepID=UPI003B00BDE8